MNKKEVINKFTNDQNFAAKAMAISSIEQAAEFIKNEGLELSDAEVKELYVQICIMQNSLKTGELPDDALDLVAGGGDSDRCDNYAQRLCDRFACI